MRTLPLRRSASTEVPIRVRAEPGAAVTELAARSAVLEPAVGVVPVGPQFEGKSRQGAPRESQAYSMPKLLTLSG